MRPSRPWCKYGFPRTQQDDIAVAGHLLDLRAHGCRLHIGATGQSVHICRLGALDGVEEDVLRRPLLHHDEPVERRLVIASMPSGVRVDDAAPAQRGPVGAHHEEIVLDDRDRRLELQLRPHRLSRLRPLAFEQSQAGKRLAAARVDGQQHIVAERSRDVLDDPQVYVHGVGRHEPAG